MREKNEISSSAEVQRCRASHPIRKGGGMGDGEMEHAGAKDTINIGGIRTCNCNQSRLTDSLGVDM